MYVVEQKNSITQPCQYFFHFLPVELPPGAGGYAFKTFQNTRFVALSLQASDKPRARVCKAFIIQIDRILRGENDP